MSDFNGSMTAGNLMKAFAGESQARNRYTFYASRAKEEGYNQVASIFLETAENEKEHAKLFYKHLVEKLGHGTIQEVQAGYPVAVSDSTAVNLESAAMGEHEEWEKLYPGFAKIADDEGYSDIARTFRNIAKVEESHETRYQKLKENVKSGKVFKKDDKAVWICMNCGYIMESREAPQKCPACAQPQSYFQLFVENY